MKKKCFSPKLAGMLCLAVNLRKELNEYNEQLKGRPEKTNSYSIAKKSLDLLQSSLYSLYYEEYLKDKEELY